MSDRKPILAVGFDGVIHDGKIESPATITGEPLPGAFDFITAAVEHFDVQIYDVRSTKPGGVVGMVLWFRAHGLNLDVMGKLAFPVTKPDAFVTIESRVLEFNGKWETYTPKELLKFKPWNAK